MRFLYSIKDALIGFGSFKDVPMIIDLPNDEVARRLVQDCCANGQKPNAFNVHPEHKELWRLASIDEESGKITSLEPMCVARAIEFIGKEAVIDETSESKSDCVTVAN